MFWNLHVSRKGARSLIYIYTVRIISRHAKNPSPTCARLPHNISHLDQVQLAPHPVARRESLPVLLELPVRLHGRAAEAVAVRVRTKVKVRALRRPAKPAEVPEVHLHLNDVQGSKQLPVCGKQGTLNAGHETWPIFVQCAAAKI